MTNEEKLSKYQKALVSLYHMLKTPLPNSMHQQYINEVLVEVGESEEE